MSNEVVVMRKALIALLLIITAFSAFTANAAENLSGYSSRCCGGYYAGYKDNKAFCLNIKSGNNILYTFDGEVSTVAMHHSKLYAVTKSGQNGRYNVIIMSGKSQTKSFSVEAELGNNCKAAVDKNGNLWKMDTVSIGVNHIFERRLCLFPPLRFSLRFFLRICSFLLSSLRPFQFLKCFSSPCPS